MDKTEQMTSEGIDEGLADLQVASEALRALGLEPATILLGEIGEKYPQVLEAVRAARKKRQSSKSE